MLKTNYHTHCTLCDGKNTLREMTLEAIARNFDILGFSSHAMYPFSDEWHLKQEGYQQYIQGIKDLKEEFGDKIELYTGFEADYIKNICSPSMEQYRDFNPDFIIGSVHFVPGGTKDEGYFEADGNFTATRENIKRFYGGNVREAVHAYFEAERNMVAKGGFTFVGHPDLIRKQLSYDELFDENESWYREEIKLTAKAIASSGIAAEVNTGGMARGYLDNPYPSQEFLGLLHEYGARVTINSDSHAVSTLDFAFDKAAEAIKKAGFKEVCYFQAGLLQMQALS